MAARARHPVGVKKRCPRVVTICRPPSSVTRYRSATPFTNGGFAHVPTIPPRPSAHTLKGCLCAHNSATVAWPSGPWITVSPAIQPRFPRSSRNGVDGGHDAAYVEAASRGRALSGSHVSIRHAAYLEGMRDRRRNASSVSLPDTSVAPVLQSGQSTVLPNIGSERSPAVTRTRPPSQHVQQRCSGSWQCWHHSLSGRMGEDSGDIVV